MGALITRTAIVAAMILVLPSGAFAWTPPHVAPGTEPAPASGLAAGAATSTGTPTTAGEPVTAAGLLSDSDAVVEAGDLELARRLYERLLREFPNSTEAGHARRALKIIAVHDRGAPALGGHAGTPSVEAATGASTADQEARDKTTPPEQVVIRQEPYSTRTAERLRLTAWEKLDFGVTSFLYGMSVGVSFALGSDPNDSSAVTMPIALGALTYTLGAVVYLRVANPDRGDLPLALAITSYIPTTTLLVANLASDNPDEERTALTVAGAGLLSIPVAIAATMKLDLDPGDTQLVRDAGFWGLVLGTAGTLGFGGSTYMPFPGGAYYQEPSGRTIAGAGMLGLYGGLGLGILAASQTEISLERVRVTTWGGYGGAILGALMGAGAGNSDRDLYRGLSIGALTGLLITFASTSALDGIPPEDAPARRTAAARWTPTLLSATGADGKSMPTFGLAGALP